MFRLCNEDNVILFSQQLPFITLFVTVSVDFTETSQRGIQIKENLEGNFEDIYEVIIKSDVIINTSNAVLRDLFVMMA